MDTTKTFSVCQYLNIVLTFNFGTSFGILSPSTKLGMHSMVFVIIAIVIFLTFWFFKSKSAKEKTFLSLVTAGAIGNLIDRFLHGAVVDFIDFHYNQYHWPAFNVADSSICIGCALFFVFSRSK
jgi:signal peptidase II